VVTIFVVALAFTAHYKKLDKDCERRNWKYYLEYISLKSLLCGGWTVLAIGGKDSFHGTASTGILC